ncbi:MAG: glycosyltransferase [Anaerolineae bacterium]|nr:glycosyltransferase [Anaerolineae bacterium]
MSPNPLVSVIIPTYNRRSLLPDAVNSVLAQTYPNYEIIVIDDGSVDDTPNWAAANTKWFRYYRQVNQGQAVARNNGAELAKGEYLAFLDADDIWLPEKLEKQVLVVQKNPGIAFTFTDGYRITATEHPEQLARSTQPRLSSLYTCPPQVLTFDFEFRVHCVPTSSILVPKKHYLDVGGMPDLRQGEDFVLCCLLLLQNPAIYLNEPLISYRVHTQNISARVSGKQSALHKILRKDNARLQASLLADGSGKCPALAHRYAQLPLPLRLLWLLVWRVRYGSSVKKIFFDLWRYLRA